MEWIGHLITLARAMETDSGLSAIYDLQAAKRSYCENAVVVLINVDLICRCHDTIIVGDEAGRLLLNGPSQPCIDALASLYTQEPRHSITNTRAIFFIDVGEDASGNCGQVRVEVRVFVCCHQAGPRGPRRLLKVENDVIAS